MKCSVTDCAKVVHAKHLCKGHYVKQLRYGNTEGYRTKRGQTKTKAYSVWKSMIARCTCPSHSSFPRYSKVPIDPAWRRFDNFFRDMGERPANMTLDRLDNAQGYSKENCRWADWHTQAMNKTVRSNQYIKRRMELQYVG